MEGLKTSSDVLFILLGAILVLAMHAGFAFLELGTVRRKNQVNALMKILVDFSVSTIAYFFIGYSIAYGTNFFAGAESLAQKSGYELVKFFFLLTFAAAVPAIVSGGIAERARFHPQIAATFLVVGFAYPFFESMAWGGAFGVQEWFKANLGAEFHDFAGSVVVHAMGGWMALAAVILLGARMGRYSKDGRGANFPPSNIPFLALGAWVLSVGWFGFNVMSAQTIDKVQGLVAVNSLMAMAGGTIAGLVVGRNDPGFVHNGPLAGLGCRLRGIGRDASARRARHGQHRRRHLRLDVHRDAGQAEARRRARRVAVARACAARGAASRAASSARRRWAASAA
jgi:Amt family ammonium transporter